MYCFTYRELEAEISKFEQICAELTSIKQDFDIVNANEDCELNKTIKKKEKPKVPPKPKIGLKKYLLMQEETPEGTEV